MSFFVQKNCIFRKYVEEELVKDDFLQLFMLQQRNKEAQIIVSNEPCKSCMAFAECIRQRLGIQFDIRTLDVREAE